MMETYKKVATVSWAVVAILITTVFSLYILAQLAPVLMPFIYGIALVYILRPLVEFFLRFNMSRTFAVTLSFFVFFIFIGFLVTMILPTIVKQVQEFITNFPSYVDQMRVLIGIYEEKYKNVAVFTYIENAVANAGSSFQSVGKTTITNIVDLTTSVLGGAINIVLAPFIAFYILKDYVAIKQTILGLIPAKHRDEAAVILHKVDLVMAGFLKGQIIIALFVGTLTGLGLWLIGVPYALALGVITGIFNIVPYLGPIVGGSLAFVVAVFENWQLALWAVLIFIIVQQIEGFILSPYIMQQSTDIHPTLIIFALSVGAFAFNIIGMLIAIPIAAALKAIVTHFQERAVNST